MLFQMNIKYPELDYKPSHKPRPTTSSLEKTGCQSGITFTNIEIAQDEILRTTEWKPSEKLLWKTLDKITPKISDFIWKIIHNRIKCGSFFQYIQDLQDRQYCPCGKIESIEHILLYCEKYQIPQMWTEIETIWTQSSSSPWIPPTKGVIMGIGTVKIRKEEKLLQIEMKRYITFITESIWNVWKLRNQRIFEETQYDKNVQLQKWKIQMQERIQLDYNIIKLKPCSQYETEYASFKSLWCQRQTLANLKGDSDPL